MQVCGHRILAEIILPQNFALISEQEKMAKIDLFPIGVLVNKGPLAFKDAEIFAPSDDLCVGDKFLFRVSGVVMRFKKDDKDFIVLPDNQVLSKLNAQETNDLEFFFEKAYFVGGV